jgi:hypothetical protein
MKLDFSWFSLPILWNVMVFAMVASPTVAARVNLGDLAEQVAAEITKAHLRSTAVADFLAADGQKSDLGGYLADKLSDSLLAKQDKAFRFLDRSELPDAKVSADELASGQSLKRIGSIWGVETVVTGVVEISAQQYVVKTSLRRVADGTEIAVASQSLPRSRILDLLSPAGLDLEAANAKSAGTAGVGVPTCAYCPIPGYLKAPAITSATVGLMVTVSTKGLAVRISVLKNPGYGFVAPAIESVSEWKFRPASGQDGAPVPVAVPVDVTFHSSRT